MKTNSDELTPQQIAAEEQLLADLHKTRLESDVRDERKRKKGWLWVGMVFLLPLVPYKYPCGRGPTFSRFGHFRALLSGRPTWHPNKNARKPVPHSARSFGASASGLARRSGSDDGSAGLLGWRRKRKVRAVPLQALPARGFSPNNLTPTNCLTALTWRDRGQCA